MNETYDARHRVFTIYDQVGATHLDPRIYKTKGLALRAFAASVADPQHPFSQWPEEFAMYEIGLWDDITGTIEMYPNKEFIGRAADFIENTKSPDGSEPRQESRGSLEEVRPN